MSEPILFPGAIDTFTDEVAGPGGPSLASAFGIGHVRDHNKLHAVAIALEQAAAGAIYVTGPTFDGVTNDTTAFQTIRDLAAGGVGAEFKMPRGTARLFNFDTLNEQIWLGSGKGKTILKAFAGAAYVIGLTGQQGSLLRAFKVDGNGKASHGVRIDGQSTGSQQQTLEHIDLQNCDTCIQIVAGATNQADKNTFNVVSMRDSNTGFDNQSPNGQQTLFVNPNFASLAVGAKLSGNSGSSLWVQGGQMQVVQTCYQFASPCRMLRLTEHITEGGTGTDIDGSTHWATEGVIIESTQLQSPTSVVIGTVGHVGEGAECNGAKLIIRDKSTLNTVTINADNVNVFLQDGSTITTLNVVGNGVRLFKEGGAVTTFNVTGSDFIPTDSRGAYFHLPGRNVAQADASILASQIVFYLDEAGNNLKARVRYANGTYKTFTGALV